MNQALHHTGYIALPEHNGNGGFDHAAVHGATGHVYVAHTANDAVDVLEPKAGQYLFSIEDLPGVAGVLVSDDAQLVFTSNRAENTIGIFAPGSKPHVRKIPVGMRPNGLAYDPEKRLILAANVGDPAIPKSHTVSIVGLDEQRMRAEVPVSGRTRWAIYDPEARAFYVNIAEPAEIVVIESRDPSRIARAYSVPAAGPHGLDFDLTTKRLFCACDAKILVTLDAHSGNVVGQYELTGVPDVVFFNPKRKHLYVAVGDPGVIDVFDTETMQPLGSVPTERGAHTLAFLPEQDRILAFLPGSHRAAVYQEPQS